MQRLVEIFRRATLSPSTAKNPLTAGAAERREWQYEDTSNGDKVGLASWCEDGSGITQQACDTRKENRLLGVFRRRPNFLLKISTVGFLRQFLACRHV